ncbi:MAG: helix-turn-helix domain-containing protein [Okeania sp. SIO3B5]|nr:helix-turn-helix domain-containing protein [Okeania sp. SIO3B5]
MKARYKYRIYPNHIQITKLNQLFGCCRYVWNSTLAHCNQLYSNDQKKPGYMCQPTLSRLFSLVCLNDGRESRAVPQVSVGRMSSNALLLNQDLRKIPNHILSVGVNCRSPNNF